MLAVPADFLKRGPKQSKGFCQKQLDKNAGQSDNYQLMSLEEFKNLSPLNASIYRWDHPGVTAESAYPPHARNRGQKMLQVLGITANTGIKFHQ